MENVRPWCGQPSDRGRLKNRTGSRSPFTFYGPRTSSQQARVQRLWLGETARLEGPKLVARRAQAEDGVLGEGSASSLDHQIEV